MDRRVVDALMAFKEQRPFWRGLRSWTGFRQIGMPYTRQKRVQGESHYTLRKLVGLATDGIMALSTAPLTIIRRFSLIATALVLMLGMWLCFGGVPSESGLLWAGLFLGCVQLVSISILGSYLGRIYDEVRGRPRWIVAERLPPLASVSTLDDEHSFGVRYEESSRSVKAGENYGRDQTGALTAASHLR
jgi:dolichol-phosphate mannosyltransferase